VPTSLLADFAGSSFENHVWTGLAEDEPEDGDESGVVDDLDVEDPVAIIRDCLSIKPVVTYHLHGSFFLICTIAEPMNGPKAIPITLVNPNRDMGRLRALPPFHTSLILPPTILIETDDAPPPKKRVTTIVAKLCAKADPNSVATRIMYETK
jgi:hypothetical protein